jgi:hypothetical protein
VCDGDSDGYGGDNVRDGVCNRSSGESVGDGNGWDCW